MQQTSHGFVTTCGDPPNARVRFRVPCDCTMQTRHKQTGHWLLGAVALVMGCAPTTAALTQDAADDVFDAGDSAGGACVCLRTDACCDGCKPKAQGKKCTPTGAIWGVCNAGVCGEVPGDIVVWTLPSTGGVTALDVDAVHLAVTLGNPEGTAGVTQLWEIASQRLLWLHDGFAQSVALLPDDATVLVVGTSPALLLSLAEGATTTVLDGAAGPVAASPDGKQIAAATDAEIRLYSPAGALLGALAHPGPQKARHRSLAFSADLQRLASATGQNGLGSPHGDVRLFDLAAPATPVTLECTSMSVDFAPDRQILLAACWNLVVIYDVQTGKPLAQGVESDTALSVAWAPDGKRFVVGTLTGGAKLYEVASLQSNIAHPVAILPVPQVAALAFSPDGKTVYVGNGLKSIVLAWRLPAQ